MEFSRFVIDNELGSIESDYSFKSLTTIGSGGNIKCVYFPKDMDSLRKAYKYIKDNNLMHFIIGNGSNILPSDSYYEGIVICLKRMKYTMEMLDDGVLVSAFYPTVKLAYDLAECELGDLSFLGGIPGLLGGAIYNNSGAYNDHISNHILCVRYIDTAGEIQEIKNNACAFGYRKSIFHHIEGIIIEALIKVSKIDTKDILEKRKKSRLLSQPLNHKSMGSIFRNNPLIPSWQIIDGLGMRGFKIGDAAVSMKHTNFIINLGDAKSQDILSLIELIEKRSKLELGIELFREITVI